MAITELMFPTYKTDAETQSALKAKAPEAFTHFRAVQGLQSMYRGSIVAENGVSVGPSGRSLLVLEWDRASSFHAFFPSSPQFQSFVEIVKPFLAGPAKPELFESPQTSGATSASSVTQAIKVARASDTENVWAQLKTAIEASKATTPQFFHGSGIEEQDGNFIGLIGWHSLQEYETAQKDEAISGLVNKLGSSGKIYDIVAQLGKIPL